jgi:serine/threonine protein kinase
MRNTGHSILQKCMLDDGLFVLKGTRADLCDIEALEQLVTTGPQPLPMESIHDLGLEVMATPRAVWTNDSYLWELQRYHEGRSLADLVAKDQKPLRGPALLAVVEAISGVLEALYEKNLVHRDINPGNILTLGASEFRVVDWSSCCRESSSYAGAAPFTPWLTPGYSAPEQEGGKAECASDWYSLGATCFALANGFTPHERGRKAFALGLKQIQLGRGEFRGWSEEEYFRGLLDPDPAARPKPWESKRRLFDIARDSKPAPGIG